MSKVQQAWAERPIEERLKVLSIWRRMMACRTDELTVAIAAHPKRSAADVRVSEILPLLAACDFLERRAAKILKVQVLGRRGRPWWLSNLKSEVRRVALGHVLVIGPSNYPLFLPGVQVLQALAAGNAVTWKPGKGGRAVAQMVISALIDAGLPAELAHVTEESAEAGEKAIAAGADKVFFTGSAATGHLVLRSLAETGTPSVMELSGCSSVVVLPEADLGRVTAAVSFGMRFNGAATCMAPRRLIVVGRTTSRRAALVERLTRDLAEMSPVRLGEEVQSKLSQLVEDARAGGATILGSVSLGDGVAQAPLVIVNATPAMNISQSDIFAPVLSVIDVVDTAGVVSAEQACPYALSVSIFGEQHAARRLASAMTVGTVLINDMIVPTADPRVPFGGRKASGFGVTRGAEGLLEMTAVQAMLVRGGASERHFQATSEKHVSLFDGLIVAGHGKTWSERWRGLKTMTKASQTLRRKTSEDDKDYATSSKY